ncbi:MAG: glycoside hydrolase family 3 protein [Clostridia bacterium]|nr:glycoside hydrolase family 3 protein [Clostridia bacterium]
MKKVVPLKLEELSTRQKIGMCFNAHIYNFWKEEVRKENLETTLSLIKEHALGSVWLDPNYPNRNEVAKQIKDAADYPIIIMCDAESGFDEFKIGGHNSLACTGNPELAYQFGKNIAVAARKAGYNCLCNPVVDSIPNQNYVCAMTVRSLGWDKEEVAKYAMQIAKGMHDGGLLTVAKHYPSPDDKPEIDSHMAEGQSELTKEELLERNLYPYLKLNEAGLLDGIMTGHSRLCKIDPEYPASLSKKVIDIIREAGFDGFAITDALTMMGVVAKFGREKCRGMSIEAGNDIALTWGDTKPCFESMLKCYEEGIISDEALDRAARHVLEAQRKTMIPPKFAELTQEDVDTFNRINKEASFGYLDEGVAPSLSRDLKHQFVILVRSNVDIQSNDKISVDTLDKSWYRPDKIAEKLKADFPNSEVRFVHDYMASGQIYDTLEDSVDFDDTVFITSVESKAYIGKECFTSRVIATLEALQVTNRVEAVVHFGNPFPLEDLPHVKRILVGVSSTESVENTLDILAGRGELKGAPVYKLNLK